MANGIGQQMHHDVAKHASVYFGNTFLMRTLDIQHHTLLQFTLYFLFVVLHHFSEICSDTRKLESTTFNIREFQQFIDEIEQLMTISIDLSKHLLAVFNRNLILVIHPKHIAETDNGIQWGAQGVTDIS